MKKQRESNIELLRIILMSMIVFWHFMVHGFGLAIQKNYDIGVGDKTPFYLCSLICYHVNCFIFISGYYGIKFNLRKFIDLFLQIFFYSLFTFLIMTYLRFGSEMLSNIHKNAIWVMYPFSLNDLWFVKDYIALFFFSPLLNCAVETISKKQFVFVLCGLFLFSVSGFNYIDTDNGDKAYLFVFMYILGAFFRRFKGSFIEKYCIILFVLSMIGLLSYQYTLLSDMSASNFLFATSYSNPFCILAAITFFFIFNKINIGYISSVNNVASGCFAAYLLTDNIYLRTIFNYKIISFFGNSYFTLLVVAICVVAVVAYFELLRKKLFYYLEKLLDRVLRCATSFL